MIGTLNSPYNVHKKRHEPGTRVCLKGTEDIRELKRDHPDAGWLELSQLNWDKAIRCEILDLDEEPKPVATDKPKGKGKKADEPKE